MVRALLLSNRATWRSFFGPMDSEQVEKESEFYKWRHGPKGRIRGSVELVTRLKRWSPLRCRMRPRNMDLEVAQRWRSTVLLRRKFSRGFRVEPVVVCMSGEADELGGAEPQEGETYEKIASISPLAEEERKESVEEKMKALNDLQLQPSITGRGWLAQLKMAFGGLVGFLPFLPTQEEFLNVPSEPASPSYTWEGWGTSLCWWANFVGGLPDVDVDYVVDLIFDQRKGLGFNIARYNIGGGADLTFDTNMRPFADLPGFKPTADGDYDWSADERQRKVLLGAKARGANVFEAFSNSPPRWMTVSGSVTGNWRGGQDNLNPEHYATFADYLTEVVKHYETEWGVHFDYLAPFNEPVEGFWNLDRKKAAQEGCNFSVSSINKLLLDVKKSLLYKGLSTQLTAADTWCMNTPKVLRGLGQETLDAVRQVNVHTYVHFVQRESDAKRREVRKIVSGLGKKLWMSEYGPLNWRGSEVDVALAVGRHITLDINELQCSAWCYWQVLETPGKNFYWGLLHAEFKYNSNRVDPFTLQIKKQYYVMMHFSRWIRPGFTIFPSEGKFRDWLVIAVDPCTKATAVLVFTNTSDRNIDISFDVSGVAPSLSEQAIQAALVRTSETENHIELDSIRYESCVVVVRLIAKSITTIIVTKAVPGEKI